MRNRTAEAAWALSACVHCGVVTLLALCILSPTQALPQDTSTGSESKLKCSKREHVKVYRALMDPKNVADVFGTRIAKRYVAFQVTVTNRCDEYQFLIHDVSLDVGTVLSGGQLQNLQTRQKALQTTKKYELSSEELSLVRGVAEKGQVQDFRNRFFRYLRAAGSIAGGLTGVTVFGHSYAASVAAFNGPFLTAYTETFPDFTINQLIRLNDSAYVSNHVIAKQHALVFVAFIPQAVFMSRAQAKSFYKDPLSIKDDVDFRLAEVIVDGNFITEVQEKEQVVSQAAIDPSEASKFGDDTPVVKGHISGQNLAGADIRLKDQQPDKGLRARLDGPAEDSQLNFVLESDAPVAPGQTLVFEVERNAIVKTASLTVDYRPEAPVLEAIEPAEVDQPKSADSTVTVTLTGKHFIPADTRIVVSGAGILPESGEVMVGEKGMSLEAKLTIQAGAAAGARNVAVSTSGGSSNALPLNIK